MGRLREGQYFCFCLDHVREYNATYNYFNGMNDDDVARYMKDATVGHRPTWSMGDEARTGGLSRGRRSDGGRSARHLSRSASTAAARGRAPAPRYSPVTMQGVRRPRASRRRPMPEAIRARYKELVKRHHPDANGGDRSREEKLREIIHAYKTLRAAGSSDGMLWPRRRRLGASSARRPERRMNFGRKQINAARASTARRTSRSRCARCSGSTPISRFPPFPSADEHVPDLDPDYLFDRRRRSPFSPASPATAA